MRVAGVFAAHGMLRGGSEQSNSQAARPALKLHGRRRGARWYGPGGTGPAVSSGEMVRAIEKDRIRFAVAADGDALVELEIRVGPDRFGGWQAVALLHEQGATSPARLGRAFRSRERRLAAGKMVAWVRRRYSHAQPLAERSRATLRPGDAAGV